MTRIQQKINWIKMHALQEAEKPVSDPFITTWNMTSGAFTLLTQTGTYNALIDWGDGTSSTHTTGDPTHTYASAGQYQIKITGQYNGLRINGDTTERDKLIAVNNWGNVGFTSFERAFYGCSNLVSLPNGSITGAENVESFRNCFRVCTSLTTIPNGLFDYCVNVTTFQSCFYDCTSLAAIPFDLFRYTVNVTIFYVCFRGCTSLTAIPTDLFKYTVNVTTFEYCFRACKNLELPTSIFNLSALQTKQPNMEYCFYVFSTADSHTGTVQPIWDYITITVDNNCFQNCTALTNYSSIPALWK